MNVRPRGTLTSNLYRLRSDLELRRGRTRQLRTRHGRLLKVWRRERAARKERAA